MLIDYGTMFDIEKFKNGIMSQEANDADSNNVREDLPPTDTPEEDSQEECSPEDQKSTEEDCEEKGEEGAAGGTAAYSSSEAYMTYLQRHPENLQYEDEQTVENYYKSLEDLAKNGEVEEKSEECGDSECTESKEEEDPEVKAMKDLKKKEAREEYLRRHAND